MCDEYLDWLKAQGYEAYREMALMASARILNGFYTAGTGTWADKAQPHGDVPNFMSEFAFEYPITEMTPRGVWVITGYQTYRFDPITRVFLDDPRYDYDSEGFGENLETFVWGRPKVAWEQPKKVQEFDDIPF